MMTNQLSKTKKSILTLFFAILSMVAPGNIISASIVQLENPLVIDGSIDDVWDTANEYSIYKLVKNTPADAGPSDSDLSGKFRTLWDESNFYLLVEVQDDKIYHGITSPDHQNDNIEIYFDIDNSKLSVYDGIDDDQIRLIPETDTINSKRGVKVEQIELSYAATSEGYLFEAAFPWTVLTASSFSPAEGIEIGFDIMVTDNDGGPTKDYILAWNSPNNNAWGDATVFGILKLMPSGILQKVTSEYIPPDHDEFAIEENNVSLFLFVDQDHMNSSDLNAGDDPALPLKTITKALEIASDSLGRGVATKINIANGTYREHGLSVKKSGNANLFLNTELVIEGEEPGGVIIKGSLLMNEEWSSEGNHTFSHNWPYNMLTSKPWRDRGPDMEIAHHREMIFVDGIWMMQVLSSKELVENSFFVDETAQKVFVKVADSIDFMSTDKEISLYGDGEDLPWPPTRLMVIPSEKDKVVMRNLTFQHANMRLSESTVKLSGWKILMDHCEVSWTNGFGMIIGDAAQVEIKNCRFDHNGGSGITTWRSDKITMENTSTSYNNWRGAQGKYYSHAVGGIKFHHTKNIHLLSHTSNYNMCSGLWTDLEIFNATYEDCLVEGNYGPGLLIEISDGILVKNSTIRRNTPGIRCHSSHNVTIDSCTIEGNTIQFTVYRDHRNFEDPGWTNQFDGRVWDKTPYNWVIKNSRIIAQDNPEWQEEWEKRIPSWMYYSPPGYQPFWHFSHSDYMKVFYSGAEIAYQNNEWIHPAEQKPFENDKGEALNLEEWEKWISGFVSSEEALDQINEFAQNDDASGLTIELLNSLGVGDIKEENLSVYKQLIESEDNFADINALEDLITKANAFALIRQMAINDDASELTLYHLLDCDVTFRTDRMDDYKFAIANEDDIPTIEYLQEVINNAPSDIKDTEGLHVMIYPNPFQNIIYIDNLEGYSRLCVYNLLGEPVYSDNIEKNRFCIKPQTLESGIYILKLIGEKKTNCMRIIKE